MRRCWCSTVFTVLCALLLSQADEARATEPAQADGPRMVRMSEEEVVGRLAALAREFAQKRGTAEATGAFLAFQDLQLRRFTAVPAWDPEEIASRLASSDIEEIAAEFREAPETMRQIANACVSDAYGITFHYVVDERGTEAPPCESRDFEGAVARLSLYPPEILAYLGHNEWPLHIYLYAEGLDPCDGASGCCSGDRISIRAWGTGSVVHEVGHAIESLMLIAHRDDPSNPLVGLYDEYFSIFSTPPEDGWIPFAQQDENTPLYAGFPTPYSLQSMTENFAETCAYYVDGGNEFISRARRQALDGAPLLYEKYLFAFRHVFRRLSHAAVPPEERAIVSLAVVDRGNGDGRAEPGEAFSLAMTIVPVETLSNVVELRCVPDPGDDTVTARAASVRVWSPQAWHRYRFEGVGDYTVSPSLDRDLNHPFTVESRTAAGAVRTLAVESVPLNERGWLWAYCSGNEGGMLVKLASTLKEVERVALPEAVDDLCIGQGLYDPMHDCFWFLPPAREGSLAWFRRGDAEHASVVPLDPDGRFRATYMPMPLYNFADGSIWLTGDANTALRLSLNADGTVGRRYVDLTGGGAIPSYSSRGVSFHPRSGKFWSAGFDRFHRYSALGALEASYGGVESIDGIATAGDGGCWLASDWDLFKASPLGALQPARHLEWKPEGLRCHPESCALWSLQTARLTLFAENGEPQREWELGPDGGNHAPRFIPSISDGSAYLCYRYDYEAGLNAVERYRPDGAVERTDLPLPPCAFLGFQTVGDIAVRRGETDIPSGGVFDFGNTPVAGPGALAELYIYNTGTLTLYLRDWTVTGADANRFTIIPPHPRIAPGARMLMSVVFIPGSEGLKTAQISIRSNDPDESPYTFTVRGRGAVPDINVKAGTKIIPSGTGSCNFGTLTLPSATRPEAVFTIENAGRAPLTLDSWEITGAQASQFRIIRAPASRNVSGKPWPTLAVRFEPTSAGTKRATLSIRSNDPDENPYTISLAGTCKIDLFAKATPAPKPGIFATPKP